MNTHRNPRELAVELLGHSPCSKVLVAAVLSDYSGIFRGGRITTSFTLKRKQSETPTRGVCPARGLPWPASAKSPATGYWRGRAKKSAASARTIRCALSLLAVPESRLSSSSTSPASGKW